MCNCRLSAPERFALRVFGIFVPSCCSGDTQPTRLPWRSITHLSRCDYFRSILNVSCISEIHLKKQ